MDYFSPRRYLLSELVDWFHRLILKADDWGFMRYDLRYDPLFKMRITLLPKLTTGAPLGNLHWERVERVSIEIKLLDSNRFYIIFNYKVIY